MGLFDSWITQDDTPSKRTSKKEVNYGNDFSNHQSNPSNMNNNMPQRVQPTSFEDIYKLLDELKLGKAVIVDCTKLKQTTAIRVIDILSGATYSLNGNWSAIAPEIFMFAPVNAFGTNF